MATTGKMQLCVKVSDSIIKTSFTVIVNEITNAYFDFLIFKKYYYTTYAYYIIFYNLEL